MQVNNSFVWVMHLAESRAKVSYAAKLVFLTVGDAINRAATENGVKRARQSHLAEKEGGKPKKKGGCAPDSVLRDCSAKAPRVWKP